MLGTGGQEDHPGVSGWGWRGLVWLSMVNIIVGVGRARVVWGSGMKGVDRGMEG